MIPTTAKEDLQQRNDDFICVPKNKIIEYTSTSGTLGAPVTVALTENDLKRLADNEHASFVCADGTPEDIYQLMLTLDRQFMAGMAYYSGIRKLGAGIIRVGPGVPSLQWQTILRIQPTAIVAVPSFILKLIAYAKEHNIDLNKCFCKKSNLHWRKHPEYRFFPEYSGKEESQMPGISGCIQPMPVQKCKQRLRNAEPEREGI